MVWVDATPYVGALPLTARGGHAACPGRDRSCRPGPQRRLDALRHHVGVGRSGYRVVRVDDARLVDGRTPGHRGAVRRRRCPEAGAPGDERLERGSGELLVVAEAE